MDSVGVMSANTEGMDALVRMRMRQLFRVVLAAVAAGTLLFLVARPAPAALIRGDFTGTTYYRYSSDGGSSKDPARVRGRFIIDLDRAPENRCSGKSSCYNASSREKGDSSWLSFYLSVGGKQYKTKIGGGWNYSSAWVQDSYLRQTSKTSSGGHMKKEKIKNVGRRYDAFGLNTRSYLKGEDPRLNKGSHEKDRHGDDRRYRYGRQVLAGVRFLGNDDWLSSASLADLVSLDDPMAWWKSKGRLGSGYFRDTGYRLERKRKNHDLLGRTYSSYAAFNIDSLKISKISSGAGAGAMAVAEPGGMTLFLAGFAAMMFWRRTGWPVRRPAIS